MPVNPPSKPNSRTSTPSLYILSPHSSTTDYTSCAGFSSPDSSIYKSSYKSIYNMNKKKLISQDAVRTIIKNAFREFRGIELSDNKL